MMGEPKLFDISRLSFVSFDSATKFPYYYDNLSPFYEFTVSVSRW